MASRLTLIVHGRNMEEAENPLKSRQNKYAINMGILDLIKNLFGDKGNSGRSMNEEIHRMENAKDPVVNQISNTKITMGNRMFKTAASKGASVNTIEYSDDGGKKWNVLTEVPIEIHEFKASNDGCLMMKGFHVRTYKDALKNMGADLFTSEKSEVESGLGSVANKTIRNNNWMIIAWWYKIDKDGEFLAADSEDENGDYSPMEYSEESFVIYRKDRLFDIVEDDLKALGRDKQQSVAVTLRNYCNDARFFYVSIDHKCWHFADMMPENFSEFAKDRGLNVIKGKSGESYYLYNKSWEKVLDMADLELYKREARDYSGVDKEVMICEETGEEYKEVRLVFFKDTTKVAYINGDDSLREFWRLPGEPTNVSSYYGDVTVSVKEKKETTNYVYHNKCWQPMAKIKSTEKDKKVYGPFCFDAYISDKDPFWDMVNSPIDEDKKEKVKMRKITLKVCRVSYRHILYLDKDGKWQPHSKLDKSFDALYDDGGGMDEKKQLHIWDIVYYHHDGDKDVFFNWEVKKGLFSSTPSAKWKKYEGVILERV